VLCFLEKSFLASRKDFRCITNELPKTLIAKSECFLYKVSIEYQLLATELLHFLVGSSILRTIEKMWILIAAIIAF